MTAPGKNHCRENRFSARCMQPRMRAMMTSGPRMSAYPTMPVFTGATQSRNHQARDSARSRGEAPLPERKT